MSEPMTPTPYPPDRHVLRDLDITTEHVTAGHTVTLAPMNDGVRDASGAAAIGFLATLTDVSSAMVALVAGQPKWTATVALSITATGVVPGDAVVASSRLVRAGSNIVVVVVAVHDADGLAADAAIDTLRDPSGADAGAVVARGLLSFARIPRSASQATANFDGDDLVGRRSRMTTDAAIDQRPLAARIGLEIVDPGHGIVRLARTDYVRNSFGAINGGVHGMVVQHAAELAVPGFVATDLQIQYLAQARTGPATTSTTIVRRTAHGAVCDIALRDAGADDLVLSLATVGLTSIA